VFPKFVVENPMTIIANGKRYTPVIFGSEKQFEEDIVSAAKILFGPSTIFINAKRKIESKSLGGTVPDGFFFDFSDPEDPQFYIVEVEITQHSFFNHVFPQITKFFAFFKNNRLQKNLVDKLYSIIETDPSLNAELRKFLGKQEVYKFLSDLVDNSQNILLIADGPIPELQEIIDTYSDTWGRLVRFLEIKKYTLSQDSIYTITPDFETIQYLEPPVEPIEEENSEEPPSYTEEFHLNGATQTVKDTYSRIKEIALAIDPSLRFNPQKYYISIKAKKNIAFLKIRKKKIRFIALMPEEDIKKLVSDLKVSTLSQSVQDFYNGLCAAVDMPDLSHEEEVQRLIESLVKYHQNA
jgi:predicted transport protein